MKAALPVVLTFLLAACGGSGGQSAGAKPAVGAVIDENDLMPGGSAGAQVVP